MNVRLVSIYLPVANMWIQYHNVSLHGSDNSLIIIIIQKIYVTSKKGDICTYVFVTSRLN